MDILTFAIKMELDGETFYTEQAKINHENGLDIVFLMLAKDEKMHAQILQNKEHKLPYKLNDSELLSKAKNVFDNFDLNKQIVNQLEVYRTALKNEKDSINLYQDYLAKATDDESKSLFEYLIKEEEGHYSIIDQLISHISRAEEWVESAEFGVREEY
ncbi:hypothetical protein Desaci_0804 [Desulfosporosinus acidiphilus SJ4]|uniref:Rubrerythrin diiron-binding domain-containing protein n=1 Tax=Desulfosporosinus acidiphilus (strain DSM 22704 / JCM 16185 / SJ4) TaxID=646529 RepID=I4D237_DESAJ|nr:ferritin family protein [Desulfosporosinus acidiphilus]AFM39861.1 hypothetical protein Desaci_0804 [Desulfosporosinus acidiphilus SJ4]